MKIDNKKLNKLKKQLRGHIYKIAKELDLHRTTVSRALDGETGGEGIIEKCIEYRDRQIAKAKEIESKI